MLFYDKIKTPSHQGERCAVINAAGGTCSCCRPIYPLLQPPATSTPAKLPCTNGLPQLAGSCIKENQDLISEILEKLFVFSSVYLTGSGSSLLFVIVMMLLFGDRIAYTQYTKVRQVLQAESAFSDSRRNTGPYRQNMLSCS